jgi:hypothetical protein
MSNEAKAVERCLAQTGVEFRVVAYPHADADNRCWYGDWTDATPPGYRMFNTGEMQELYIVPCQQGAAANMTFSDSLGRPFPDLSATHF